MSRRLVPLFLLILLATPLAFAQDLTECQNGSAEGFACDSIDLYQNMSLSAMNATYANDIWGWTDPQTGNEYALVGLSDGTAFVDISDPNAPVNLGKMPSATGSSLWRDIKVYDNHAFVVADNAGNHGMQVFDLTRLRSVTNPPETFTADANYNGVSGNRPNGSHNIAINEDSGFAYIIGSDDCAGGLHMVNIQTPTSPTFAGCFSSDGYTHDVQCVNYTGPDADYSGSEICVASNTDTITIVDVTNKSNPVMISQGLYPNPGYTHQGWFTEDQRFFLVDDESDHSASPTTRTIIMDLEDLDNPSFDFFHFGPNDARDHNLYVRGHFAFLSNYSGGLRVVDLAGIESGVLVDVGFFDTYPANNNYSFEGQWSNYPFFPSGTLIATDQDSGLFILKTTFPITTDATAPVEAPGEDGYSLSSAYPNPFADGTRLTLSVARAQHVTAEVLDITGRRVKMVYDGTVSSGASTTLKIEGTDLPVGLYLIRVTGEDFSTTRRISLVR